MTVSGQPKLAVGLFKRVDRPVVVAFGCIVALLLVGSLYSRSFLSPEYLLQQLKVASFLGVIATGHDDRHSAWPDRPLGALGRRRRRHDVDRRDRVGTGRGGACDPFGIACGVVLGLVNGFGVAYLRIPSMIITLAVNAVAQGLMVVHTGGFSPQDLSSPAMRTLATGDLVLGLPNALIVWAVVGRRGDLPAQLDGGHQPLQVPLDAKHLAPVGQHGRKRERAVQQPDVENAHPRLARRNDAAIEINHRIRHRHMVTPHQTDGNMAVDFEAGPN